MTTKKRVSRKKKIVLPTRGVVRGKKHDERLKRAYQDWKSGKENSLKELSEKHHLHQGDISKYITLQINLSKKQTA